LLKKVLVRHVLLAHSERLPTHNSNILRNWPLKHLKFLEEQPSEEASRHLQHSKRFLRTRHHLRYLFQSFSLSVVSLLSMYVYN
jgi:cytochrome oxidase assembly protein ShyY1